MFVSPDTNSLFGPNRGDLHLCDLQDAAWKCAPADYYITHLTCLGQKFMPKDNICQTIGSTKPASGWFQKEWDKGGRFKWFVFCSLFWFLPFLQSFIKCMVRDISFLLDWGRNYVLLNCAIAFEWDLVLATNSHEIYFFFFFYWRVWIYSPVVLLC